MKKEFSGSIFIAFFISLSCPALAIESVRTEFEKSFIGKEWKSNLPDINKHPLSSQCMFTSGQLLQQNANLNLVNFICTDGRLLSIISQRKVQGDWTSPLIALDAFHFPKPKEGEQLMSTGDCSLNGDTLIDFTALVRMGDRERVDWQTGVLKAWIPNVTTKKYEALSTRNIVCGTPTPP